MYKVGNTSYEVRNSIGRISSTFFNQRSTFDINFLPYSACLPQAGMYKVGNTSYEVRNSIGRISSTFFNQRSTFDINFLPYSACLPQAGIS
jgi:hypothetical protein